MKPLQMYQCELCDAIYGTAEDAEHCEKEHRTADALEITEVRFAQEDYSHYGFPARILITIPFHSGCAALYTREREGSVEDFCED